jgi:hypothetical protein
METGTGKRCCTGPFVPAGVVPPDMLEEEVCDGGYAHGRPIVVLKEGPDVVEAAEFSLAFLYVILEGSDVVVQRFFHRRSRALEPSRYLEQTERMKREVSSQMGAPVAG